MTEETDGLDMMWPPAMWKEMQSAGEQALTQQQKLMKQMLGGGAGMDMNQLGAMSQLATFKTRVQSGGRLSIPDAEREALGIDEGDIVQAVVLPVTRSGDSDD
ncbi:MAG: AbrB/MazE/SpoVT family DNA-binding domain-containing protein [Halococcoides sp.]